MSPRKPITVRFLNRREIRMGSPYDICDLSLSGSWKPTFDPDISWQPHKAWSPDGAYLALVAWDTVGNTPGFRVHVVAVAERRVTRSRRVVGFCEGIEWREDRFVYWVKSIREGSIKPT